MTNDQTHPPEITNIEQTSATPELPPQIATLDAPLQALALRAISARRRRGEALLEAARWLHEAHTHAQTGEWDVFLETTGTSRDTAEQLLNLHIQTMRNPRFAELIRSNWLHPSAAMLLAHPATPPDVIDAVLATTKPLTVAAVTQQIRAARGVEPPPAPSSLMATGEELALSLPKGGQEVEAHHTAPDTRPPIPDQIPHNAKDDEHLPTAAWEAELDPEARALLAELRQQFGSDQAIADAVRTALRETAVTFDELGKRPNRVPRPPATKETLRTARRALEALHDYIQARLKNHKPPTDPSQNN